MTWPLLALTGAIAQAAYSTGVKAVLPRVSPYFLAGSSFLVASGALFSLSFLAGFPPLSPGFFPAAAVTVGINLAATLLLYRALSLSDLSLCIPMLSFTPVFLIATSALILGEIPDPAGLLGIFLIAAGSYLLAARAGSSGFCAPLGRLFGDPGIRLMLVVAFLYSISVNYDKIAVETSDPLFSSAVIFFSLGLWMLAAACIGYIGWKIPPWHSSGASDAHRPVMILLPALGFVLALEAISINLAYTLSIVPYVISVKRLSIFFAVLFGGYFLREGDFRSRAAGSLVMIAGTVLIALWG